MRRNNYLALSITAFSIILVPAAVFAATPDYTATPAPATSTARPAEAKDPSTGATIPAPVRARPIVAKKTSSDTMDRKVTIIGGVAIVVLLGLLAHLMTRKIHHQKTLAKAVAALPPIGKTGAKKA